MSPDPKALAALAAYWRGVASDWLTHVERIKGDRIYASEAKRLQQEAEIYNRCATHLERVLAGQSAIPSFDDN